MSRRSKLYSVRVNAHHHRLYRQFSGVAVRETRLYCSIHRLPRGMSLYDVAQIARMGLWCAVLGFDHKRGAKFLTYASVYVRGYIANAVLKEEGFPMRMYYMRGKDEAADQAWAVHQKLRDLAEKASVNHHRRMENRGRDE